MAEEFIHTIIIFFWLAVMLGLSLVLDGFWRKIFPGGKYRFFLAPGIVVHEISHAAACIFCGSKILKIRFFSKQGGYVKYGKPKIPLFGQVFISFAPVLGGIIFLAFSAWLFNFQIPSGETNFSENFWAMLGLFIKKNLIFMKDNFLSWQFLLFFYIVISVSICLTPSLRDFKNALGAMFALFLLGIIFYYLGFLPQFLSIIFNKYLEQAVFLGVTFEILALFFTVPVYFVKKIVQNF